MTPPRPPSAAIARHATSRLLLGGLAGIAGTAAMTVAARAMHRHLSVQRRYPLPPREIVESMLAPPAAAAFGEAARRDLTIAAHFGYGAATGALFALARREGGAAPGAAYGVLVWAGSYLALLPALGVLRPATRHPLPRNPLMIAVHLVWGATTGFVLRELEHAEREVFAGTAAPDAPPRAA